jgi:hypothetical protein
MIIKNRAKNFAKLTAASKVVAGAAIAFSLLSTLSAISAQAAVLFVNNRAGLGANDAVDWSQLGSSRTTLSNPFSATSTGGLGVTGQFIGGAGQSQDQGNGWIGNFATGDALVWSNGSNGPLTLTFANTVAGVGTQIQTDVFGSFTGSIEAFDSSNTSLGLFSGLTGVSDVSGNNSAVFWGISSTSSDIKSIVFNAFNGGNNFAINQLSLVNPNAVAAVPEPFTIVGTLIGSTAALPMRKKLKSNDKG